MIKSWLFVPGDSERKIHKAQESGADALILDWEDAVAAAKKPDARSLFKELASTWSTDGPALYIRINAMHTPHFQDDMLALPTRGIQGVIVPKACGVRDIQELSERLRQLEESQGVAAGTLNIIGIATETAASVLALGEFRAPIDRLQGLMWGGEDLAADLGIRHNRTPENLYKSPFSLARDFALLAASAAQCLPIDAVYTRFRDLDGLSIECQASRASGFASKAAIHPDQIPIINRAFQATGDELEWARQVVAALETATGVAVYNGEMIDAPHLRLAHRLLGT
ncbi:CoA ester lyase [Allopusillimonas ginsengisoli]|nr:CoA ester lyase [Allopusillimonas ginsengisoli]